jgi:hypothetical protein
MPLIACAVEGILIALALWGARRLVRPLAAGWAGRRVR